MTASKKTVIVADDSATTVMLLSLLVERMGFTVVPAKNGFEVLKLMHESPPDGLLLDLNMPLMDGRTTLRHMRQDIRLAAIPVIVITVESGAQARYDCLRLGCSEFMSKPVNLSVLHDALQVCFNDRSKVRRRMRAPLRSQVRVFLDGRVQDMNALNVSERGIFLQTNSPFPLGTQVSVSVVFDDGAEHTFDGVVIRQQENLHATGTEFPAGVAVEFTHTEAEAAAALRHLVHHQLLYDLAANGRSGLIRPEPDSPEEAGLPLASADHRDAT